MKMTLHLLVKDLRATRPWWVVVLVLAVGLVVIPVRGDASGGWSWNNLSFWLGWLLCLAVLLMQSRLLSLDPPAGAERFIGTRPVSGWRVVAGKVCVLVLMGLLPLMLAFGLRIFRLGMDAGALRTAGMLVQDGCLLVLVIGMLCLPYAMQQSVWTGLAAMLAALLLFMFGNGLMFMPFAMDALPAITVLGAAATGVMGAMLARYGRLSGWSRFGGVVLAAFLGGWLSHASFGPLIRPRAAPATVDHELSLEADRPRQLLDKAAKMVSNLALSLSADRGGVSVMGKAGTEVEFRQHLQLRGLPEGVYADFDSASGHYQIAGQGEWRELRNARADLGWVVTPDAAFHAVPGNPKPSAETLRKGQTFYMPLGRASVPELHQGHDVSMTLKGEAVFLLYRTQLEKVVPIVDGGVWASERVRLNFSRVHRAARQVQFLVEVDVLDAGPQSPRRSLHDGLLVHGFFGLQNGAGKPTRLNCLRGWSETHPLLRHERFTEQVSLSMQDRWWGFPDAAEEPQAISSRDAELAVFRREVFATVKVPFEFQDAEIRLK